MKFSRKPLLAAPIVGFMAVSMALGSQTTFAQQAPTNNFTGLAVYGACSTTDVASAAASALGITATELRKDIVAGQSLQAIAQSKNVDLQTVATAIQTASKADIDQAVKDGILTEDEATQLESGNFGGRRNRGGQQNGQAPQGNQPGGQAPQGGQVPQGSQPGVQAPQGGQPNAQGPQGGQQGFQAALQNALPDINNLRLLLRADTQSAVATSNAAGTPDASGRGPRGGFGGRGFGGGFGGANFDVVKPYVVAAQALNMKCSDLVKTLITTSGKTISAVATDQKIDSATVTTALTTAYKTALAQDVTGGIITQAQSDQVSTNLDQAVTNFVNNTRMGFGPRPPQGQ